jgi:hypothetical protein
MYIYPPTFPNRDILMHDSYQLLKINLSLTRLIVSSSQPETFIYLTERASIQPLSIVPLSNASLSEPFIYPPTIPLIPNPPRPMMRQILHAHHLPLLHGIVQEKVNQNGIYLLLRIQS